MTMREELSEQFGEDLLFLEEAYFDDAVVGIVQSFNNVVVCYDLDKVMKLLMDHSDMNEEDAVEYFYYNILGAYVGEKTPVFLEKI